MEMQQRDDIVKSTPTVEIKFDGDDTKYITSLSTILVATIQEAKDRISQMEYIFCSQLYPKFQTKARNLQDIYGEANHAAQATWRGKENDLLQKIERLKHDKEEVFAENKSLKVELSELSGKLRGQQLRIDELDKLVQGFEEEFKLKGAELMKLKLMTGELQKELKAKDAEVLEKGELLLDLEKEKEKLIANSKYFEDTIRRLDEEMQQKKTAKAQEGRKFSKELNLDHSVTTENKQQRNGHEEEQKWLRYEVKLKDLPGCLGQSHSRTGNLESELLLLEKKFNDLVKKHKSLTSQHAYLLRKCGYTSDNMFRESRSVEQEHSLSRGENQIDKLCITKKNAVDEKRIKVKEEIDINDNLEQEKEKLSIRSVPFNSREFITPRSETRKSFSVVAGTKRPAGSSWIETRAHQNRGGPDPHDDFLDTPFENIKENLNKGKTGAIKISPASSNVGEKMKDLICDDDDDDETQDMNVDPCPQQQQTRVSCDGKKNFKYVEAVRKKAERENLRGIECKQCKKFYDAVLPENEGKNKNDVRCEHNDGVSRHRYKYVPPMTPDGFWNIGFESEM